MLGGGGGGNRIWQSSTVGSIFKASLSGTLPPNAALIGYATNGALCISAQLSTEVCEPVWPSGKALGWQAEGPRLDSRFGSAVSSKRWWFVDTVL